MVEGTQISKKGPERETRCARSIADSRFRGDDADEAFQLGVDLLKEQARASKQEQASKSKGWRCSFGRQRDESLVWQSVRNSDGSLAHFLRMQSLLNGEMDDPPEHNRDNLFHDLPIKLQRLSLSSELSLSDCCLSHLTRRSLEKGVAGLDEQGEADTDAGEESARAQVRGALARGVDVEPAEHGRRGGKKEEQQ